MTFSQKNAFSRATILIHTSLYQSSICRKQYSLINNVCYWNTSNKNNQPLSPDAANTVILDNPIFARQFEIFTDSKDTSKYVHSKRF